MRKLEEETKIREIEDKAISAGKSRAEVLAESTNYEQSVVDNMKKCLK